MFHIIINSIILGLLSYFITNECIKWYYRNYFKIHIHNNCYKKGEVLSSSSTGKAKIVKIKLIKDNISEVLLKKIK